MRGRQQIRRALEQIDEAAPSHTLPTSAQVWSRLQFRLAYRPRRDRYNAQEGTLMPALYILAFLLWFTWSGWLSVSFLAVLGSATGVAMYFLLHLSRVFRS